MLNMNHFVVVLLFKSSTFKEMRKENQQNFKNLKHIKKNINYHSFKIIKNIY
jgi:hypothetical protein